MHTFWTMWLLWFKKSHFSDTRQVRLLLGLSSLKVFSFWPMTIIIWLKWRVKILPTINNKPFIIRWTRCCVISRYYTVDLESVFTIDYFWRYETYSCQEFYIKYFSQSRLKPLVQIDTKNFKDFINRLHTSSCQLWATYLLQRQ